MNGGNQPVKPIPEELEQEIAVAAWTAARSLRSMRFHRGSACPTTYAPYGPQDPGGTRVKKVCRNAGCLDWHHDLLTLMHEKIGNALQKQPNKTVARPPAYCARAASNGLAELLRRDRARRGLPAKPHRDDGAASRVNNDLEGIGGRRGQWLVAVFRIMRVYATMPQRSDNEWPLDWLNAELRTLGYPAPVPETQLRQDIQYVLDRATQLLGARWVYQNLLGPLSTGMPTVPLEPDAHTVEPNYEDMVLGAQIIAKYKEYRGTGDSVCIAAQKAVKEICGMDLPRVTQEIRARFRDFEEPPRQG